jgi:hypothetical protein
MFLALQFFKRFCRRHAQPLLISIALIFGGVGAAEAQSHDKKMCDAIRKQTSRTSIWYGTPKQLMRLNSPATITRLESQRLYLFVLGTPGEKGLLNLKFVYDVENPKARTKFVSLHNDRWPKEQFNAISNICAGVTLRGYEQFHLKDARNYCLSRYFHQTGQNEFQTLSSKQRKESFAFRDMTNETIEGPLDLLARLFNIEAKAAVPSSAGATLPESHLSSWIRNFSFKKLDGDCVPFNMAPPNVAKSVRMRIEIHQANDFNATHDWNLTFQNEIEN